jgi:hypothetical protein
MRPALLWCVYSKWTLLAVGASSHSCLARWCRAQRQRSYRDCWEPVTACSRAAWVSGSNPATSLEERDSTFCLICQRNVGEDQVMQRKQALHSTLIYFNMLILKSISESLAKYTPQDAVLVFFKLFSYKCIGLIIRFTIEYCFLFYNYKCFLLPL